MNEKCVITLHSCISVMDQGTVQINSYRIPLHVHIYSHCGEWNFPAKIHGAFEPQEVSDAVPLAKS